MSFKRYFFKLLKSYVLTDKGVKRLKYAPPTFFLAPGKRCTLHTYECPPDCAYSTLNKKILLRASYAK